VSDARNTRELLSAAALAFDLQRIPSTNGAASPFAATRNEAADS
jgi:hypothetical protein